MNCMQKNVEERNFTSLIGIALKLLSDNRLLVKELTLWKSLKKLEEIAVKEC
jgi:hypothetical protein